ncbi:MAG: TetR family transcriptional regulator [Burkholderiales bacterium]|nr:TetR family transcriptional regulator [Burkholderiales bacterium]OJX05072.1 MAG: TetR family transcriptional regulator [Burkholderiales bacterium 70-64]
MDAPVRHLPADERRAVTVETVIGLAAEQNPSEITTAAIATRMGLTQGALFRHFPTKDAIWQAVMEWVAERLFARIERAAAGAATPLAALEAIFQAHVEFIAAHPGVPRMLFGELQRAEGSAARRMVQALLVRYRARVVELIAQGQAQGEIAAEIDPAPAATLFIGAVQGLVMQSMLAGDVKRMRRDAPGAFAIFRRGIGSAS